VTALLDVDLAYLADRRRAFAGASEPAAKRRRRVIAVDSKALKGSARLEQARRHLLSAVTHEAVVTFAGAEVGSKMNETRHFKPPLARLVLAGDAITSDALHTVDTTRLGW
jgi:hypothetical protein